MKLTFKKLMNNPMVLYVLAFLSLTNLVSFLASNDLQAAVLFIALAVLTSHFTKNRTIILSVALLVTHLMKRRVREGMTSGKKKRRGRNRRNRGNNSSRKRSDKGDEQEQFSSGKIDQAATLKKAYNNLDNVLGKNGMDGVTKDTAALIKQQQKLMNQIESATPVLNNAMKMMESSTFQKIANGDHMKGMENMTEMMSKFGFDRKN